jgi:hypothetical protein
LTFILSENPNPWRGRELKGAMMTAWQKVHLKLFTVPSVSTTFYGVINDDAEKRILGNAGV